MNVTIPLSLQIHNAMKIARHIFIALSLVSAIPTLTVIVLCANRASQRYAVMLGLLVELWVGVTNMTAPLFFGCFLERHQAVQSPMSRWLLPMHARNGSIFAVVCLVLSVAALLRVAEVPNYAEQELLQRLADLWPTVTALGASCFDYSVFMLFSVVSLAGLSGGTAFTSLISWHTLRTLRQASTLSETMKKVNTSMTKVLIVQAIFPTIFSLCPLMCSLIAVIIHLEGPLPFSTCYLSMSFYALLHSIVQLTVSPIHRKKLMSILQRNPGQRRVSTVERMYASSSN